MKYLLSLFLALCLCMTGCTKSVENTQMSADESSQESAVTKLTQGMTESMGESTTESQETQVRWDEEYAVVLADLIAEHPEFECTFCLYDLNGDQSPELFVKTGTGEADFQFHVFTVTAEGAQNIGSLPGGHSVLCGLSEQNACLLQMGHMGYETIQKVTMENGVIMTETLYDGMTTEYHQFSCLTLCESDAPFEWDKNPADENQSVLDNFDGELPYLLEIPFADQSVFDEPSYDGFFVQTVEQDGVYTIVRECMDGEGNVWGELKSGAGWVDLTDLERRISTQDPMSANYADDPLLESGNYLYYSDGSTEYSFFVAFRAYETLKDVRFYQANLVSDDGTSVSEIHRIEQMSPEKPFVAEISLPGDFSAYAIGFTDSDGQEHLYVLTSNGRNNALCFYEQ